MRIFYRTITYSFLLAIFALSEISISAPIKLRHSESMEMLRGAGADTIINIGSVEFDQGNSHLKCDSSLWVVGKHLLMWGNVVYSDGASRLSSDTLIYNLIDSVMYAMGSVRLAEDQSDIRGDSLVYSVKDSTLYVTGDSVIITSVSDSMRAVGKEAFIDRVTRRLELLTNARVEFGYPDTLVTRSLAGHFIRYEYDYGVAIAQENVVLSEGDSRATGDCGIIEREPARVRLYDNATLDWLGNFVSGEFITIQSSEGAPERIDVYGDAVALFTQRDSTSVSDSLLSVDSGIEIPLIQSDTTDALLVDSLIGSVIAVVEDSIHNDTTIIDSLTNDTLIFDTLYDTLNAEAGELVSTEPSDVTSKITGSHLAFDFQDGLLSRVDAFGQAYSYYTPITKPGQSEVINITSGDSIQLYIEDNLLHQVKAYGSVVGDYVEDRTATLGPTDTASAATIDTIHYSGERIIFNMEDSIITLAGVAGVAQSPMSMTADSIIYKTGSRFVKAYAHKAIVPDSSVDFADDSMNDGSLLDSDSSSDSADAFEGVLFDDLRSDLLSDNESNSDEFVQEPFLGTVTLLDGSQDVGGEYIEFSMVTRKGLIIQSRSEYDAAYYTGSELFREQDDVFFVDGGTYTTCEYDSPHFHFWSKHMKMIQGNKLIAKPVIFFIEKIPIFALPFYVFPMEKGRRSGILNFRFGNFSQGGRFLANLGYYWAASEYWDIQSWMDYYETSGPSFSSQVRYNKRYSFSGNVGASVAYTSTINSSTGFLEQKSKRWRVNFNHRQTISPTFNVNASGNFLSDSRYFTDFTDNLEDRLNRSLRSQVNFSKRLGRMSLSGSYVYDENLDGDKRKTETFPNLNFSMPAVQIFGSAEPGEDPSWYHSIRMGYSSNLRHFEEGRDDSPDTVILADTNTIYDTTLTIVDSISNIVDTVIDSSTFMVNVLERDTTLFRSKRGFTTYRHGTSVGPNFTVLSYFPVSFSVRYSETWFNVDATNQSQDAGIQTNKLYRTYSASANASISTHIYGTVKPKIFGLQGIRHELNPSVSYGYTPDIRFDQATKDAAGFVGAGSVTNRSQSINVSMRNVFDIKVGSEEKNRKITLLTLSSSASYNPEATENRWSDLSTSFQSRLIRKISLSGNMVHSLEPDPENGRLQNFSLSTSFGAGGNFGGFVYAAPEPVEAPTSSQIGAPLGGALPVNSAPAPKVSKSRTWSFSIRHTYSEIKGSPTRRNFTSFNAGLQLTPNMSVTYSQSYDIFNKKTVNRHLRIHRILHRWEGLFDWTPTGSNRGFSFRINVIAMPDIKFEKSLTSSLGRQLLTN